MTKLVFRHFSKFSFSQSFKINDQIQPYLAHCEITNVPMDCHVKYTMYKVALSRI